VPHKHLSFRESILEENNQISFRNSIGKGKYSPIYPNGHLPLTLFYAASLFQTLLVPRVTAYDRFDFICYDNRRWCMLRMSGHLLTPANQLMVMGIIIWSLSNPGFKPATF
jgi:hypothetical protein